METNDPSLYHKNIGFIFSTTKPLTCLIYNLMKCIREETLINSTIVTVLLIALPIALNTISFDPFSYNNCIKNVR